MFDYTAHGDAINIAARLEGANKYLGIRICVSADTAAQIRGFGGRPIGKLWLKGKREGTEAFEPLGGNASDSPAIRDYLEAYRLLSSNSSNALEQFEILCRQHPDDALARFHLERLMAGQTGPTSSSRASNPAPSLNRRQHRLHLGRTTGQQPGAGVFQLFN